MVISLKVMKTFWNTLLSSEYYAKLFGPEEHHDIRINQSLWDELKK
jgi:hypothetical protein